LHSVRDSFTADKLSKETTRKTINTACPSMWKLNDIDPNIEKRPGDCLFTLTDYRKDQENDSKLIGLLLESFKDIHFFPQGSGDLDYIRTLDIYTQNKTRIKLLPHDYKEFKQFINSTSFVYIGTRLHGGIKCLDASKKALILAVDNRAHEIGNDFLMPVIPRTDYQSMQRWLENKWVFSGKIKLPVDNINRWKQQFSSK
jgi:polysaccharide pyruvyl transferase WcaK-like protein